MGKVSLDWLQVGVEPTNHTIERQRVWVRRASASLAERGGYEPRHALKLALEGESAAEEAPRWVWGRARE